MTVEARLTIVIADDHAVVRQGLRLLLEAEDDLTVVGEAIDLAQTCAVVRERAPAVLVLYLHTGRRLSLGALAEICAASPATAVVILTMENDPAFVALTWAGGPPAVCSRKRRGPTPNAPSAPSERGAGTSIQRSAAGR